jgi:hypothetical protein
MLIPVVAPGVAAAPWPGVVGFAEVVAVAGAHGDVLVVAVFFLWKSPPRFFTAVATLLAEADGFEPCVPFGLVVEVVGQG